MALVCLDTQILIWGIQENSRETQKEMIPKTKAFFEECRKHKITMMIPSVVIGEFLTAVDSKYHAELLNVFSKSFIIYSFDAKAAAIFAKLWREKKESGLIDKIKNDSLEIKRQELKADCMIVASALSAKADKIYSYDKGLKNFASHNINVLELPEVPYQNEFDFEIAP